MICYVLAMGKQQLGPHVVVGYGIKIFWPGLFITSPDHLVLMDDVVNLNDAKCCRKEEGCKESQCRVGMFSYRTKYRQ